MYEQWSDEEIVKYIKNDNAAIEYLIRKYLGVVKRESRTLYLIGAESEDLIQEGLIGFLNAIKDYDEKKGASFSTFATICIKRQMLSAVKRSNRKKHSPLNSYISFYSTDTEGEKELVDALEAGGDSSPEEIMLDRLKSESLQSDIDNKLSQYEKTVLTEYLKGDSYEGISERLGKPVKSIDNAIQRIRKKLNGYE